MSYLDRYSGSTQRLYAYQLREWFAPVPDQRAGPPLAGIQRVHVEL
ncbi:MAG: hypothetical protein ABIP19_02865 [Dermatophilaceae bacterium]